MTGVANAGGVGYIDYAKVIDGPTKSDAKALRKSARQVNR